MHDIETAEGRGSEQLLARLLHPRSIAIIGASDDPVKISGRPLASLLRSGYAGRVLPVNPNRSVVQDVTCYPELDAIDGEIDLAIVAVNATATPTALRACAARGVAVAICFAAGFAEGGQHGAALQAEIGDICRQTGLRVLGPNCLGAIGVRGGVAATFSSIFDEGGELLPGRVALVSQSGAFGTFIFSAAQSEGLGFSHFVNTGNEVDLSVADLLLALAESDDVDVLLAYFEGVSDGTALVAAAQRAAELGKPIVAVKTGRSAAGARAVCSHTASLAGQDAVFDAVARQLGIIRVPGMEPLIDAARLLASGTRATGRRLSILSVSGGAGALASDLAADAGLQVDAWSPDWQHRMAGVIPAHGSPRNPIDLTGTLLSDPGILERALDATLDHPNTDIVLVLLGNVDRGSERLVAALHDAHRRCTVPVVVVWTGGSGRPRQRLAELGVPCYTDPGRAIAALGALADHGLRPPLSTRPELPGVDPAAARTVLDRVRAQQRTRLDEAESAAVLAAYGIHTAPAVAAAGPEEAVAAAAELGGEVAVKALSPALAHKSDLGVVRLGRTGPEAVRDAAREVLDAARRAGTSDARVLVQRMAEPGLELVLGVAHDAAFGPVVLAGMGGVLVELLADSAIALPPLDLAAAQRLLRGLRGAPLLDGGRDGTPRDLPAAAEALARVSLLAADLGDEIAEVDVNPLVVGPRGAGAVAVDALVVLRDP
ncbi:MAG: hypothetical protein GEV09_10425 [Pseudonocardiaceae bacterium]|nr:hypothetical protein [Pseudonocardiaceae bacterium]